MRTRAATPTGTWTLALVVGLGLGLGLGACYSPNYESKPCKDKSGCPVDYYCVSGLCSRTPQTVVPDAATGNVQQPGEVKVDIAAMPGFTIGSLTAEDMSFKTNDTPAHIRTLVRGFYLEEKEVTVAQYKKCVDAGACKAADTGNANCNYSKTDKTEHPINCVDYLRATAYCQWLGKRLPTETEWEYAAKGPNTSALYAFGSTWDMSKTCFNAGGTCPVGSKGVKTFQGKEVASTADGFYDLSGNVYEWTQSEFCSYSTTMDEGLSCGSGKSVVRGGSAFDSNIRSQTVTVRFGNLKTEVFDYTANAMTSGHYNLGIRCARDL